MTPTVLGKLQSHLQNALQLTPNSDAFAGGFIAGLVQGKPLETQVDMGQWLASWGIRQLGPAYPAEKKVYGQ